jgi:hypothetical protein
LPRTTTPLCPEQSSAGVVVAAARARQGGHDADATRATAGEEVGKSLQLSRNFARVDGDLTPLRDACRAQFGGAGRLLNGGLLLRWAGRLPSTECAAPAGRFG